MLCHIVLIDGAGLGEIAKQTIEQRDIAIGLHGEMQIGNVAGRRSARIDDNKLHRRPCGLGRCQTLVKDRMAPGHIGADKNDEIGELQILVAGRHGIGTKGAAVAGNGRSHAEA